MQKGIQEIEQKQKEIESLYQGNRIGFISLKDREYVEFRWLTTSEELIKAKIHTVTEMTPKGVKYLKKYCTLDETGACEYCVKNITFKTFIYLWAWVYNIYHTQQNPRLNDHPEDVTLQWVAGKANDGKVYYKQEVDGPMVFKISQGAKSIYQKQILELSRDNELNDRDYRMTRSGKDLDTTYTIKAKKEGPMPAGVETLVLPDLGDVVRGKIRSFGQEPGDETVQAPEVVDQNIPAFDADEDKEPF